MILSHQEYDVLNRIASNSKMDCWFCIKTRTHHGCEYDYVFDLENHKQMSLRSGVAQLIDGSIDINYEDFTEEEMFTLIKLLGSLMLN